MTGGGAARPPTRPAIPEEAKVFIRTASFGVVVGAGYGVLTGEPAGAVLLLAFGLASAVAAIAIVVGSLAGRASPPAGRGAEGSVDAPTSDDDGEPVTHPGWAPLIIGIGLGGLALGAALGPWLGITGLLVRLPGRRPGSPPRTARRPRLARVLWHAANARTSPPERASPNALRRYDATAGLFRRLEITVPAGRAPAPPPVPSEACHVDRGHRRPPRRDPGADPRTRARRRRRPRRTRRPVRMGGPRAPPRSAARSPSSSSGCPTRRSRSSSRSSIRTRRPRSSGRCPSRRRRRSSPGMDPDDAADVVENLTEPEVEPDPRPDGSGRGGRDPAARRTSRPTAPAGS